MNDEPVEACPPSAGYRLRKLARRYRIHLRVAAAVFLVLVMGVIASAWQALRATRAEEVANEARQAEYERAADLAVALERTEGAEKAERQRAGELTVALRKVEQAEKAEKERAEELKKHSAIRPSRCSRMLRPT